MPSRLKCAMYIDLIWPIAIASFFPNEEFFGSNKLIRVLQSASFTHSVYELFNAIFRSSAKVLQPYPCIMPLRSKVIGLVRLYQSEKKMEYGEKKKKKENKCHLYIYGGIWYSVPKHFTMRDSSVFYTVFIVWTKFMLIPTLPPPNSSIRNTLTHTPFNFPGINHGELLKPLFPFLLSTTKQGR